MSLHSNVGESRRKKKKGRGKGKKKQRDAWGVVGRNLSMTSGRSMQMFGWYPFGNRIALPKSSEEEEEAGPREGGRRSRKLSNATNDSNAAPLESCDIVSRVMEEEQRKNSEFRANFEPEVTNETWRGRKGSWLSKRKQSLSMRYPSLLSHQHLLSNRCRTRTRGPAVQDPEPERKERCQHHLSQRTKLSSPTTRSRISQPHPVRPLPILSHKSNAPRPQ